MASRQRRPLSSAKKRGKSENMRPVISTDVMGNRNVEIVPVGAWVEPANGENQVDAVLAAQIEEEKIQRLQEQKENQVRNFQRLVKKRLGRAREIKRQQQVQEAEKAFELERRVVLQSFQTGDLARKDTCSLRQDFDHAIRKRLLEKYGEDVSQWDCNTLQDLGNQVEENHYVMDKARQQLSSKQVLKLAPSVQAPVPEQHGTATRDIQNAYVRAFVDVDVSPKDGVESQTDGDTVISADDGDDNSEYNENQNYQQEIEIVSNTDKPTVRFSGEEAKEVTRRRRKKSAATRNSSSVKLAHLLSQFKEGEVLEQQKKQQAAVSRRIFMDREREAVRENIRKQQHRLKITGLKKEKEAYRQELEDLAQQQLEPVDLITPETDTEEHLRKQMEGMEVQEMVNTRKQELRRQREMERYLDALRHNLLEKARRHGVQLPSLCACGENVWDTHPETCANNCFFYKNHRAYARSLQSLLSSIEVM